MIRNKSYKTLIYLLLVTMLGCSEHITESTESIEDNNETPIVASFSEIQNNVFNKSCALSGCHVSGSVGPNLSGNSYSRIVNVSSSTGMPYITPNNPEQSYLLNKIKGINIQGSRMPIGSSPLNENTVNSIIEWINNGAPNN